MGVCANTTIVHAIHLIYMFRPIRRKRKEMGERWESNVEEVGEWEKEKVMEKGGKREK